MATIEEQLRVIKRGCEELLVVSELVERVASGRPLKVKLGMDPTELKRKNMLHDGDETHIGGHISHIRGDEALDKAIQMAGYNKAKTKNFGRGLEFS